MLHLYYFESLLEQHGIFYGYKIGPNMMGIQVGYNKNYHRKCIKHYDQFDAWWLFWDIKVVMLGLWNWEILLLKLASPVACTYGKSCVTNLLHEVLFWLPSLWVKVGIARWLTPTNPSPRSMHSSTLLRGLINFCNKYMSSLWLMCVHGLYALLPFRNLLASTVPCIALSHLESWCKLCRCIQTPWYDTLYHT